MVQQLSEGRPGSSQCLASGAVAVAKEKGVPLPQQLLCSGKAADLPAGGLPFAVAASRGRGGRADTTTTLNCCCH